MPKNTKLKAAHAEKMKKKVQIKNLPAAEKVAGKVKGGLTGSYDANTGILKHH
jgi:hypothetical protein